MIRAIVLILFVPVCAAAQTGAFDWSTAETIALGIQYTHQVVSEPRPLHVHAMQVDVQNLRVHFHTTTRHDEWIGNLYETRRTTTRDFMRECRAGGMNMVVAINADAFEPWPAPYAERSLTDLRGLSVSDGELVSPPLEDGASFLVYADRRVAIERTVRTVNGIEDAISGFGIVLENGIASGSDERLAPRTGIGVSKDGRYVYFLVIDGRRHESHGATTPEVGKWLGHLGADDGVNLDGGGSATMVRHDPSAPGDGVVLLNSPVGDGRDWLKSDAAIEREQYQPAERANGNNLGVYLTPE